MATHHLGSGICSHSRTQRSGHLGRQRAGDDEHVRLPRAGPEREHVEAVHVVDAVAADIISMAQQARPDSSGQRLLSADESST